MKKIDITSFTLMSAGLNPIECAPPFSLSSAYLGRGVDGISECELAASFSLSGEDVRCGSICLKTFGVGSGAVVSVNGKPVIAKTNCASTYSSDIKQLVSEGENTIQVVFKAKPKEALALDKSGIFGFISICLFERSAIDTVTVRQSYKGGAATLDIGFSAVGPKASPRAVATLLSPSGKMYYTGMSNGMGKIKIPDPVMWRVGGGDSCLYKLTVTSYIDDRAEDIYEEYIGLCDTSLFDEKNRFSPVHNGEKIFPLAARIWDIDSVYALMTDESIDAAVAAISEAGVNMLCIDSGEFCPNDGFYRACDRRGVLVARTLPPLGTQTSEALALRLIETSDVLTRVANHASLALLVCDEADISVYEKAIKKSALNLRIAPRSAFYENADVCYIASPPSPPPLESAERVFCGAVPNLFSPKLSGISGREDAVRLFGEIAERYLCPSGYEGFAYASALASADVTLARLADAKIGEKEYTGAVLDCIYDRYPATSGSALDWSRVRKALFFGMRKLTQERALWASVEGGRVTVYSISDIPLDGELHIYLKDSENRVILEDRAELSESARGPVYSRNFADFINGMQSRSYVEYRLHSGKRVEFSGSITFVSPKEFSFCDPGIRANVTGSGKRFEIDLIASAYARGVELAFSGVEAELSDNLFDITENMPMRVGVKVIGDAVSADELRRALRIRSVYDIGRKI